MKTSIKLSLATLLALTTNSVLYAGDEDAVDTYTVKCGNVVSKSKIIK